MFKTDRNRTALVTGATGFVGRRLVRRLLSCGWNVRALVRHATSAKLLGPDVVRVHGDITDSAALRRAVAGTDVAS